MSSDELETALLNSQLQASLYRQLTIRLSKAVEKYAIHLPTCEKSALRNCSCGLDTEINSLIKQGRAAALQAVLPNNQGVAK
jgi:hypothetical protein